MAETPEVKRRKVSSNDVDDVVEAEKRNCADEAATGEDSPVNDLDKFKIVKVLNHLREKHCIFLLAKDETDKDAVVKLEKTAFDEDLNLLNRFCSSELETKLVFNNDIYSTLMATPSEALVRDAAALKASVIHPATPNHIIKYSEQEVSYVTETAADYRSITLPYLESNSFDCRWIHNILDHKKETERIIFEDDDDEKGFVLLPDMKWDGRQLSDLYLSAIVRRRDLKSIRDLRAQHLPLLRNILTKGVEAIEKKYSVPLSKLVMYFHYQPTYYHLHVHFTHVSFEAQGRDASGAQVFQTVLNLIEKDGDHFASCDIPFKLKHNSGLYKVYKEAGKI